MGVVSQLMNDPGDLVDMSDQHIALLNDVAEGATIDMISKNPELRAQIAAQVNGVAGAIKAGNAGQ